jgi:hypothetical protein
MKIPKIALLLCSLLLTQTALASTFQFRVNAKGVVAKAATPAVVVVPAATSTFEGSTLMKAGASAGLTYGTGAYYSGAIVSTGVAYYEVQVDSGTNTADSFFGFIEASHLTPTSSVYWKLNGSVFNNLGVIDINTINDKTEFSPYVVKDSLGTYNGPATLGFSANFTTHTIKIYVNNAVKYTLTNLPDKIQLRAAKSWNGSGVFKFDKASWTYNPENL